MQEVFGSQYFACLEVCNGETSQPLHHRLRQHCQSSYDGNYSAVFKHTISSWHQIDVNDVILFDKEKNLFECGVKEVVYVRTKNPSLSCSGSARITLSHSWDHSMNTLRSFSPFPRNPGS